MHVCTTSYNEQHQEALIFQGPSNTRTEGAATQPGQHLKKKKESDIRKTKRSQHLVYTVHTTCATNDNAPWMGDLANDSKPGSPGPPLYINTQPSQRHVCTFILCICPRTHALIVLLLLSVQSASTASRSASHRPPVAFSLPPHRSSAAISSRYRSRLTRLSPEASPVP